MSKIRVKHGQTPGDISKQEKIELLSTHGKNRRASGAKTYRKMVKSRERAVGKEQARKEIYRDA